MKTISIYSSAYEKRFSSGGWLVAANGFDASVNSPAAVFAMGRHRESDEAFVLLNGDGFLVTAGFGSAPDDLSPARLLPGKLFVVERGEWHALVLLEGAQTLIVENADTGAENSDRAPLTGEQREQLQRFAASIHSANQQPRSAY